MLKNISLRKGDDGHWLSVQASNGKQASICIENMQNVAIVKSAFVQWAKDQIEEAAGVWKNLTSSNIKRARYIEAEKTLEVEFNNGGHYGYKDVPESVFNDFIEADSPGRAFASEIKGLYTAINLNDKEGGK